jgi:hypothetical protein
MTDVTDDLWIDGPDDIGTAQPVRRRARAAVFPAPGHPYSAFPECWVERLDGARRPSVAMYRVALAIARSATLQKTLSPKLANKHAGVKRGAKYRALKRLQGLGLIRLEQGPGCAPVVHILLWTCPE